MILKPRLAESTSRCWSGQLRIGQPNRFFIFLRYIIWLYTFFGAPGAAYACENLFPLLTNPAITTITLDPGKAYCIPNEYHLRRNLTILGNGATINILSGPLHSKGANVVLTVDRADIQVQSGSWAGLAATEGSRLIVQNGTAISCAGAPNGIFTENGTLTVSRSSIDSCSIGIHLRNFSVADLHGVSITSPYGIQVQGNSSLVTVDQNSFLSYLGPDGKPGIGVLDGASVTVKDSTLIGFGNAIDVQPSVPGGTAKIINSVLQNNLYSGLAAVNAKDIQLLGSRVENAQTDGVYLQNSPGIIENSEIIGSLNTGVTFWACSAGAIIRNSLIKGSAHQGVAIVLASRDIQVLNNTFINNQLPGLFMDSQSTAKIQGNIFTSTPGFTASHPSIYLQGTQNVIFDSTLVTRAAIRGAEILDGSNPTFALSLFTHNNSTGILAYNQAAATVEHSSFWNNSPNRTDVWPIFVNLNATANARYCTFGPAGYPAFYNNAGTNCYTGSDYWGALDGPVVLGNTPTGSGALLGWNPTNGSWVNHQPFLTWSPIDSQVNSEMFLASGNLDWDSGLGVTLTLKPRSGIAPLNSETVGALRVNDTAHLGIGSMLPPPAMINGKVYVVWVSTALRRNSLWGSLSFSIPPQENTAYLQRRNEDGTWSTVPTTWDPGTRLLTYRPDDIHLINGTFGITRTLVPATVIQDLIVRFYNVFLERNPDPGAIGNWPIYFNFALAFAVDVKFIPPEIARMIILSAEYQGLNRSDTEFLTDSYLALLNRPPSQWELDNWLRGVWSRPQVISMFYHSDEVSQLMGNLFPGFSGLCSRSFLARMYVGLLSRLIDAQGLLYWSDQFEQAISRKDLTRIMARAIVNSPEFKGTVTTPEETVIRLYLGFLDRFPATGEIAYWAGKLRSGALSVDDIINEFAGSSEFDALLRACWP